jgi:predicted HicB family RNase H-like nuclease
MNDDTMKPARVEVAFPLTMRRQLKARAALQGTSMNALINQAVETLLQEPTPAKDAAR